MLARFVIYILTTLGVRSVRHGIQAPFETSSLRESLGTDHSMTRRLELSTENVYDHIHAQKQHNTSPCKTRDTCANADRLDAPAFPPSSGYLSWSTLKSVSGVFRSE